MQNIAPCLWFDERAEQAARYYVNIFPNSKIVGVTYYSEIGQEMHGKKAGTVMSVSFELNGNSFMILNGGGTLRFNEGISLMINCDNQNEIDNYYTKLSEGGKEMDCGWLQDKYGVCWQVIPRKILEWYKDAESESAKRVMTAMLRMKKIDIDTLERAYRGN